MEIGTILIWILAVVLVVAGFAGVILPALPGPPLVLAGLIAAAWAEDFAYVGAGTMAVLVVLTIIAVALDFLAGSIGARRFGSTRRAAAGAALGAIVGIFFGLVGVLIGPFVGAVLGELSANRTLQQAGQAGLGAWLGLVMGTAAKIAICFAMVGIFILVRFL